MPVVYAALNMAKTKTGALIVIEQGVSLQEYEKTGDVIDALINSRLIENIFFKNSPLHDGALIVARGRLASAGCILPVSHDTDVPRSDYVIVRLLEFLRRRMHLQLWCRKKQAIYR